MNVLNRPGGSPTKAKAGGGGGGGYDNDYDQSPKPQARPVASTGNVGGIKKSTTIGGGKMGGTSGPNTFDNVPIGGKKNGGGFAMDDEGYSGGGGGRAAPPNTVPCGKCGRNFGEDRISKHERACKVNAKPKKVKMFHKPITEKEKMKMDAVKEKTSKWRQQHEEFV